jgi:hypothetical protein
VQIFLQEVKKNSWKKVYNFLAYISFAFLELSASFLHHKYSFKCSLKWLFAFWNRFSGCRDISITKWWRTFCTYLTILCSLLITNTKYYTYVCITIPKSLWNSGHIWDKVSIFDSLRVSLIMYWHKWNSYSFEVIIRPLMLNQIRNWCMWDVKSFYNCKSFATIL